MKRDQARNAAILAARDRGQSLSVIARRHRITRERVRQILLSAGRMADHPYFPLNARIHHAFAKLFGVFGRDVDDDLRRVRALSQAQLLTIPNIGVKSVPLITKWLERYAG